MHGNTENLVIPNGNTEFPKFLYPENSGILNSQKIPIPELQYSRRKKNRDRPLPSFHTSARVTTSGLKSPIIDSSSEKCLGKDLIFVVSIEWSRKSYVILMGGSCQMLTIDDKGGGSGVKNPKNLLT